MTVVPGMPEGDVTLHSHKVAFYADIFYNSELSPAYWIPPANLDVEAILLGGDIHYLPDHLAEMLGSIRETRPESTQIIVVPGNGEYVDQELSQARRQYRAAVDADSGPNNPSSSRPGSSGLVYVYGV
jgi:hypothetical protein